MAVSPWRTAVAARRRPHALVLFGLWPLATALATALALGEVPYSHFSLFQCLGLGALAVVLLWSDFLVFGGLCWLAGLGLTAAAVRRGWLPGTASRRRLMAEPVVLAGAVFLGTCLYFPAALRHPFLAFFDRAPATLVAALCALVLILLATRLLTPGRRGRGLLALALFGLAAPWPAARGGLSWYGRGSEPPLVLLGLDSLAMTSPLGPLHELAARHGGTVYERTVTPGLITNAVWHSLLLGEPVSRHGVFFAGQTWPRPGERSPVLGAAAAAGYQSISVIPDQSSCGVGTTAGFDEDRSGPLGWRQIVLPPAVDASVLLALLRPLAPRLPASPARPNLAGTFSYDLDRELVEILTAGRGGRPTLVAAHSAYLHMQAFPRLADLNGAERRALLGARLGALRDRSFDWLDRDLPDDPLPLHRWKHDHLLRAVGRAIETTAFLTRGGRLAIFSDHGERPGLTRENFADPRFFHVPLVTFHLPARDPRNPISLRDLPALAGLTPGASPAPPVVEYAMPPETLWPEILRRTHPRWNGELATDPEVLAPAFAELRAFAPWPPAPPG